MLMKIFFVVFMLLSVVVLSQPCHAAPGNPGIRFEITGGGTLTHIEGGPVAGSKPVVTKVSAAVIALCIAGTGNQCNVSNLEIDAGGKAYLYIPDGDGEKIFVSTDPNCAHLTELDGIVGGTGTFMYGGEHTTSGSKILIQGTVTFDKTQFPSFVPLGIKKGSIMAVSDGLDHYGVGTFATVAGTATPVSCLP